MTPSKCYLNALGILCSVGACAGEVKENLQSGKTNLTVTDAFSEGNPLPLGLYQGTLPDIPLPENKWQSRNNQFALAALNQITEPVSSAIARFGRRRIGVVVGTSTSGIAESEPAIRQWARTSEVPADYDYGLQEMGATAQFVATVLGVQGPAYGISTACSSGAKALATARRLIRAGICDAVIAGGVDTLCKLTVLGFSSLEAVSDERCNPFSKNRKGINIGEGAALFLVTADASGVELTGVGEGSDAHHISAPDPTGAGAIRCMTAALKDGGVQSTEVGYVNLHGTATALNDQMESLAMYEVFGSDTFCSSTKPFTGHTLGAAGAVEAGICWLMLSGDGKEPLLPRHIWDGVADPELPDLKLVSADHRPGSSLNYALSNSFAFGGNNISLLLGRIK
ncbi:beta-ketoacyl-[acyl-carrier-protein] synthase family protein [Marinobacterium arenosum]|uniref:beta-ketoacyl-[acyl-carrier-protein] synthase family protein n=1 Tax=Marinobacterium arenosum TaxID=2862496 RepID=UPI001C941D50|nr:beta-ketoacyl-[acyl-carrier-protein] synthase family protein [Marinobacterium arenosum]MBY4676120.1 beta-ketoacyl-[acyl-carrier-protein] synthase family protein [Marinobacterium arenosum]